MIDLRRIRALREVADRGTITAAADALHLTTSAVSQQLAALEREAGVPLVEPSGRTVRLTPAAHVLLAHAGPLFAQLERLRSELATHAMGDVGELRVAAFPTALRGIVAPAIVDLRERAPGVRLKVREAEPPDAVDALGRREADLVVVMESPEAPSANDQRYHRRELARDLLDAVLPADHPLAESEEVQLESLAGEPWVAPLEGWSCDHVFVIACRAAGFTPAVEHRTTDWAAVTALVGAGLGVALVPRLAQLPPTPGVVTRPLSGEAPCRHLLALCRSGAEQGAAIAHTLDAFDAAAALKTGQPLVSA
jgi:DNA-binding transcriptional LysR family regulator